MTMTSTRKSRKQDTNRFELKCYNHVHKFLMLHVSKLKAHRNCRLSTCIFVLHLSRFLLVFNPIIAGRLLSKGLTQSDKATKLCH